MLRHHTVVLILLMLVGLIACSPPPPEPTPSPAPATATAPPVVVETSPAPASPVVVEASPTITSPYPEPPIEPTAVATESITPTATVEEYTGPPSSPLPLYTRAVSETITFERGEPYRIAEEGVEVRESDEFLRSDVDGDGDDDLLVPIKFIRAEGGEFSELSYLVNEGDHYTSSQSILLGEQIFIQSMSLEGTTLLVQMYTHGERDFLCCPTAFAEIRYEFDGTTWVDTARTNLPAMEPPLGTTVSLTTENISFDTSGFAARPIVQLLPDTDTLPPTGYQRPTMSERLYFSFAELPIAYPYAQTSLTVSGYTPPQVAGQVSLEEWLAAESIESHSYMMNSTSTVPYFLSYLFVETDFAYFDFGSGSGGRYLALPGQQQAVSSYDNFYYIYRGLTADGQHEIVFVYPLSHPDLDALLPLSGRGGMEAEMAAEAATIMAEMNRLAEGDLSETIAMLDAFAASITITP